MAYTPTTWVTGDTVTATKLNKLEQGVANAGSALICTATYSSSLSVPNYVLDKTVQEIYDALLSGTPAYIKYQYGVLGVDFTSHIFLAPIIKIYSYNTTAVIKIIASRPYNTSSGKNNYGYIHSPSLIAFSASSMSDYPVRDSSSSVPLNTLDVSGAML